MARAAEPPGDRSPPAAWLTQEGADVVLRVLVKPRASRSRVVEVSGAELVLQLAAPPVDGQANQALRELLAKLLGVAKGRVALCGGETSRHKRVRVTGVTTAVVVEAIPT